MPDPTPNPVPDATPAPTPAPDKPTTPPPAEKTFTQAELDSIVGNRAKEAKQAALDGLLKELGFEKADDLKTLVTTAKQQQEAQLTELEKAQKAAKKAADEKAELEQKLADSEKARVIDRRNALLTALATKAHNAKDVIRWAEDDGKALLEKVVGDDGSIDEKAAKAVVDACAKAMPHYFGSGGVGSPSNRDGRVPQPDEQAKRAASQALGREIKSAF